MLISQQEIDRWGIRNIQFRMSFAGGISTLQGGFQIAWVETEECPILCFLCDVNGQAFARFDKDKTTKVSEGGLSRAEEEAVEGMQKLVLKWY